MIEAARPHLELRLIEQHTIDRKCVFHWLALEATAAAEPGAMQASSRIQLVCHDDEIGCVVLHQVPCIRGELVLELPDELLRPVHSHTGIPPQTDTQQMIEAGEVIHVRVRNEHVADPEELTRREPRDIADIEEQRTPLELEIDVDARVAERPVDKFCVEYGPHGTSYILPFRTISCEQGETTVLKKLAVAFGVVFLVVGVLGFVSAAAPEGHLLGLFHINALHNVVHLASGAVALWAGLSSERNSKLYFQIFGVVYAAVAILGFVYGDQPILGLVANNTADTWLHVVIAIVALYLGFGMKALPAGTTTTTA